MVSVTALFTVDYLSFYHTIIVMLIKEETCCNKNVNIPINAPRRGEFLLVILMLVLFINIL